MTFIDGVNVIFEPKSFMSKVWTKGTRGPYSEAFIEASAEPNECSVIYNLKKMLVSDYPNSAVIATVDRKDKLKYGIPYYLMYSWKALEANMVPNLESDYPFDLLTQEGEKFDDVLEAKRVFDYLKAFLKFCLTFENLRNDHSFSGWELFDPFVPVEVPAFSPGELDVMIDYLVEKK